MEMNKPVTYTLYQLALEQDNSRLVEENDRLMEQLRYYQQLESTTSAFRSASERALEEDL